MKKIYKKPDVYIENFVLSEAIASCDYSVNATTTTSCATNVSEETVMAGWKELGLFGDSSCEDQVSPGMDLDWAGTKMCYHTSAGANVFSS